MFAVAFFMLDKPGHDPHVYPWASGWVCCATSIAMDRAQQLKASTVDDHMGDSPKKHTEREKPDPDDARAGQIYFCETLGHAEQTCVERKQSTSCL